MKYREDFSNIEITESYSVLGAPIHYDYAWVGKSPYVRISRCLLDSIQSPIDNIVHIGPYKLKLIDNDRIFGPFIYIRMDYPFWWLAVAWHKASRLLDITYEKLIITLAVWGLAEYNQAVLPTWRDIYLVQKLMKMFHKQEPKKAQ